MKYSLFLFIILGCHKGTPYKPLGIDVSGHLLIMDNDTSNFAFPIKYRDSAIYYMEKNREYYIESIEYSKIGSAVGDTALSNKLSKQSEDSGIYYYSLLIKLITKHEQHGQ